MANTRRKKMTPETAYEVRGEMGYILYLLKQNQDLSNPYATGEVACHTDHETDNVGHRMYMAEFMRYPVLPNPLTTKYHIKLDNEHSISGHDAEGNYWTTWGGIMLFCDLCGKRIDSGYCKETAGEREYYCTEHIKIVTDLEPVSYAQLPWPEDEVITVTHQDPWTTGQAAFDDVMDERRRLRHEGYSL